MSSNNGPQQLQRNGNLAAFNASRLPSAAAPVRLPAAPAPSTTRDQNAPYRRPQPDAERSDLLRQIMDEVRKMLEEQRKVKEDVRRVGHATNKLEDNVRLMGENLKEFMEQAFSIESSPYKDNLLKEASILFTASLKRQPTREEIGHSIVKVLQNESRNKMKFNKAKTFVTNRLTDLRSEERRRVFGNRPCEAFPRLTTPEFADRFLSTIKASDESRSVYIKHLALLRKFARDTADAANDTFKKFRQWLDEMYPLGFPSAEDWEIIQRDDEEYMYDATPVPTHIGDFNDDQGDFETDQFIEQTH